MNPPSLQRGSAYLERPTFLALFVFGAAYILLIAGPLEEYERLRKREPALMSEFEYLHKKLVNREALAEQMQTMSATLIRLNDLLPYTMAVDRQRNTVLDAAHSYGIEVQSLTFGPEVRHELIAASSFEITATGGFEMLYAFVYRVFYASRKAVVLRDFTLQRLPHGEILELRLKGLVFRLLERETQ